MNESAVIVFLLGLFLIVSAASQWESELIHKRMTGELRKACSKRGNAVQPTSRINTTVPLARLRKLMFNETVTRGIEIDAYLIPSEDDHQSEFVSEHDKRLEFISGFSGSYGVAIVTANKSLLWTDGRYHLQADTQLDCNWFLMREGFSKVPSLTNWLKSEFPEGAVIGVDPRLIAQSKWEQHSQEFLSSNISLIEIDQNLIDVIWSEGRPPQRYKEAFVLEEKYSGRKWHDKIRDVREKLANHSADAMVITALDEIAWLLNIRGRDIPHNPFVRSYVILDMYQVRFFVNETQLHPRNLVTNYFNKTEHSKDTVKLERYEDICVHLQRLSQSYTKILIPTKCGSSLGASRFIHNCIPVKNRLHRQSPIIFLKAKKNPTEIQGMHYAHVRDGAAMCDFMSYFENKFRTGEHFTELRLVKLLNEFRFEQEHSFGNSFRTIAGYGSNGALPHYEPTPNTNAQIQDSSTLILDSGGQYFDGTTDVTRTLHLGKPTDEMKEAYTRVLIGQIELSTLTFPSNMKTPAMDVLSRAPLWEIGLDYMHGTSHGVGSFLSVHEAPISMHFNERAVSSETQELKPGYFLSNEPGFYREGDFGIRLENVLEVVERKWLRKTSGGHPFLGFKTVTLVPYEPKLIDLKLLSVKHRKWLNSYNELVRTYIGEELKRRNLMDAFYWMMDKTVNIPEHGRSNIISGHMTLVLFNSFCVLMILL